MSEPPKSPQNKRPLCFLLTLAAAVLLVHLLGGSPIPGHESAAGAGKESGTDQGGRLQVRQQDLPVRQPAGAGLFYPKDAEELFASVERMLGQGRPLGLPATRAILVPHAGYMYSGEVAAAAMRELARGFRRVFIIAANHSAKADFTGVSLPPFRSYAIPGAEIPVSRVVDDLLGDPFFTSAPDAHAAYMIEVELPFLHALAGRPEKPSFAIIPMIAGKLDQEGISKLAETLNSYADEETVFVFSVDLSHFYPDATARQLDYHTIDAILSRDAGALATATADGNQVLMAMIGLAEQNGWDSTLLQYKNSGDVTGDRSRVVGYAGIAFHQPVDFAPAQRRALLDLARTTLENYLESGTDPPVAAPARLDPILAIPRGVFVTLKQNGQLRGCIGDIVSNKPLSEGVRSCAIKSATRDPRFKPVTRDELDGLAISISVLDYPRLVKVHNPSEYPGLLKPGRDGVILIHKGRQSTYLPQVWQDLPDPVTFLSSLCRKQGSPADCWQDPETQLFRYGAYEFGEK